MHKMIVGSTLGMAALLGAAAFAGSVAAGSPHRPVEAPASTVERIPGAAIIGTERKIELTPGLSRMVELSEDAAEIFVGNPAVANALVRSSRKLYILAVNSGLTSIYAMDRSGRQIAAFQVSVRIPVAPPRDVGDLSQILRAALPRANIDAHAIGDTIILRGSVASAGDAQQAMDIAKAFLPNISATTATGSTNAAAGQVVNALTIRGKDQVMLKVSVIEIQRNVLKQLGVNTNVAWSNPAAGNNTAQVSTISNLSNSITNTLAAGDGSKLFQQSLQAFERYGVARTLAEPTVTAVSGESAKFTAGGEIPVIGSLPTVAAGIITAPSVDFKQYGVTLNFSPVVLSEGRILLRLATEVTDIDTSKSFTFQGTSVPAFLTRKNETTVELPSGGSIVTAGLLQTNTRQTISGLPGAMNLPILGALFRSREYQRDETELMIVVTPYIAKSLNPDEITRPDDGFADASDPQTVFLGRVNKLYSSKSNPQALSNFKGRVGFIND